MKTKAEFRELFLSALERAATAADKRTVSPVPRSYSIELHAPGHSGNLVELDDALRALYLSEGLFYAVIDVAIVAVSPEKSVAFVRVSGHAPAEFGKTWNPADLGPFKLLDSDVEDRRHPAE